MRQHASQACLQTVDHQAAKAWHSAHQVMKLALDGWKVVKDIGVVKFQIVQNGCAGAVMHKLAALVKESGVVFVGFNHKVVACVACGDFA